MAPADLRLSVESKASLYPHSEMLGRARGSPAALTLRLASARLLLLRTYAVENSAPPLPYKFA
jgi:hypothetical protein